MIWLDLALAFFKNWYLQQIDVNNVFFHEFLNEDVYMKQPSEFEDSQHPDYVCKLRKDTYGLKQSPQAWLSYLSEKLYRLGFHWSKDDTSLYVFHYGEHTIYMLFHVDDIVTTLSVKCMCINLWAIFPCFFFPTKDLSRIKYFLGIEVTHNSRGLHYFNQCMHLISFIELTWRIVRGVSTPMSVIYNLTKDYGKLLTDDDAFKYRSMVGGLQYITLTRPDISFLVN